MRTVLILGEGLLLDFVLQIFPPKYQVVNQSDLQLEKAQEADIVLVLHDTWQPAIYQQVEKMLQQTGIPWLRSGISFGEGIIGPLVRPGVPGCSQCSDLRRLVAGHDRQEMWKMEQKRFTLKDTPRDVWASHTGLWHMAHLIVTEAERVLEGKRAQTEGQIFLVNLKTFKSSKHFFLPDPECPICGQLPKDTPEAACIKLKPNPKINQRSYRCRSLDQLKEVLSRDYLDARTGLLNGKMYDLMSPFADASVNLPFLMGDEGAAGRTHSFAQSEQAAILEGLERYCGIKPRGKQVVVQESYRNVKEYALYPPKVGVHAMEQYEQPNFPFTPFDPDRSIEWVWGYSLLEERPKLVPKSLAYYSFGCGSDAFVYETSNGCAVGGSLEEAIFYGIMEVIERDSFLITWYAQLPLAPLDPRSVDDRELHWMIDRLETVTPYDLYFYNSTMEHGIPSVWAVAKNRTNEGGKLICAAGAHLNPVRAVKGAIHELAGMILMLNEKMEANREKAEQMFHNPFLVREMEDHSLLYGLPQAEERFHFLLDKKRPLRTFAESFQRWESSYDLTDDLNRILQVFQQHQLEVIVVDQTTPEILRNGLYCVKVLIPGMLPITFGYHLTRLCGLERVLKVPMDLGFSKRHLALEELNPHPHPFP